MYRSFFLGGSDNMPAGVAFLGRGARSDLGLVVVDLAGADRFGVVGRIDVSILTGTLSLSHFEVDLMCC
jgi:hypothetical protein